MPLPHTLTPKFTWDCRVFWKVEIAGTCAKAPAWVLHVHMLTMCFPTDLSHLLKPRFCQCLPFFLVSTSIAEWPAKPGFIVWLLNHSSFQFQLLNACCCPAKPLYPVIKSPINPLFNSSISHNMTTQGSSSRLHLPSTSMLFLGLKHHNWTQYPSRRLKWPNLCTLQQTLLFSTTYLTRDSISPLALWLESM